MSIFRSLSREQKEAIGLLQIGTFLEYFDLMLYVHMAVLLNEMFFPKTDAHSTAIFSAFAFCSTFVFRPLGALIFGWIGDNIGRKATVIITTIMMSISCVVMANVPTYAQIGIGAAWIVTLCRVVQGFSSLGEVVGAQIYLTETIKPPIQYPAVSFLGVAADIGGMFALGIATLVTITGFNWRIAFWIGAGIAVVGSIARSRLRETAEFELSKKEERIRKKGIGEIIGLKRPVKDQEISSQTLAAYFLIQCGWPLSFYITFIYIAMTLTNYNYTAEDIIFHNFFLSMVVTASGIAWAVMTSKIYPLNILKIRARVFTTLIVILPFFLSCISNISLIFLFQSLLLIFCLDENQAASIFIKNFPVFKRFKAASLSFALSRSIIYIFTSFGLVYVTKWIGYYSIWLIVLPPSIGFLWGVNHFMKLEGINRGKCLPNKLLSADSSQVINSLN